jgi:hypothetical protein
MGDGSEPSPGDPRGLGENLGQRGTAVAVWPRSVSFEPHHPVEASLCRRVRGDRGRVTTPSVDLTSGMTYYWRAQARDPTRGVDGPYSTAQGFATVFPEDGSFPYRLAIHAPSYCVTHNTHDDGCGGTKQWDLSDYSFDGTLTVTTDNVQFSSPLATFAGKPLTLGFGRLHNRLSGAISGVPNYPLPNPGPFINAVSFGGVVAGDTDNAGHFEGTFDGSTMLIREGFPCYHDITCSTSGFTWTLTPH